MDSPRPGRYRHFKGNEYQVIGLATHSESGETVVVAAASGAVGSVVGQIANLRPERIVYVSYNPQSQARDLAMLTEAAAYTIEAVQPVDMFPHTFHIESVARLERI